MAWSFGIMHCAKCGQRTVVTDSEARGIVCLTCEESE